MGEIERDIGMSGEERSGYSGRFSLGYTLSGRTWWGMLTRNCFLALFKLFIFLKGHFIIENKGDDFYEYKYNFKIFTISAKKP